MDYLKFSQEEINHLTFFLARVQDSLSKLGIPFGPGMSATFAAIFLEGAKNEGIPSMEQIESNIEKSIAEAFSDTPKKVTQE